MWISRDSFMEIHQKADLYKEIAEQWKINHKELSKILETERTTRDKTYYTKEGYRFLESKHNQEKDNLKMAVAKLETEVHTMQQVLKWKEDFINLLTSTITQKEKLNAN